MKSDKSIINAGARMPQRLLSRLTITTRVDNVRAIGAEWDLLSWSKNFQRNCQYVGATLNVEPETSLNRGLTQPGLSAECAMAMRQRQSASPQ